jgi:hypothetical protein
MTKSGGIRWVWYVTYMEALINAYIILAGKPDGKDLLGRQWSISQDCPDFV